MKHIYYAFRKALTLFRVAKGQHETIDLLWSYLAAIRGSLGSNQYRILYRLSDGEDVLQNGVFSCAWYVSSILSQFRLIGSSHATVKSTVEDLRRSGYKEDRDISEDLSPALGSVIVWEAIHFPGDPEPHEHIGFYVGNGRAVSNDYKTGVPVEHDLTFGGTRKIKHCFCLPFFT